jgi:hypothetical protein
MQFGMPLFWEMVALAIDPGNQPTAFKLRLQLSNVYWLKVDDRRTDGWIIRDASTALMGSK